jgi:hypothetical protein
MKAKEIFFPTGSTGLTGFVSGHPDDGRKKSPLRGKQCQ